MRLLALAVLPMVLAAADLDRDGLDDQLEQQILDRYVPELFVSAGDCDGLPSEMAAGSKPVSAAKNGTIYGQVFPARDGLVEVHYYHLWARDCGLAPHALDAEHISGLVSADGKAIAWYAAAHEDTVCDWGEAARAEVIGAVERGPSVWISHGKHASYLKRDSCGRGCGGDRCENSRSMPIHRVINIGEPGAPLNGATWTASSEWNLLAKMGPDFDEGLIARLPSEAGVFVVASRATPWPVMLAGTKTANAIGTGHGHTGRALTRARGATSRWLRERLKR